MTTVWGLKQITREEEIVYIYFVFSCTGTSLLNFIWKQQSGLVIQPRLEEQDLLFESKTYEVMFFLLKCYKESNKSSLEECILLLLEHAMALNGTVDLHVTWTHGCCCSVTKGICRNVCWDSKLVETTQLDIFRRNV